MSDPAAEHHDPVVAFESAKLGLWTFLATEVLLFTALFAGYGVYRYLYADAFVAASKSLHTTIGLVNTIVLITSSFTVAWGLDHDAAIRALTLDAAKILGVSEADVIASLDAGDLKGKKIGTQWRITRAALAEFLK